MEEVTNKEEVQGKVYEIGYLLVPKLTEEEVPAVYGNIKELVSRLGGEIVADEMPKLIPLAYTMGKVISNIRHKFDNAYFGWTKFMMDADKVAEFKKTLTFDPNFVRFLIIKTVKENTIASRRSVGRDMARRKTGITKPKGEEGEAAPINKEAIDKEIDALVSA